MNQSSKQNAKNSVEKDFFNYSTTLILGKIVAIIFIIVLLKLFAMKLLRFLILKSFLIYLKNRFLISQILYLIKAEVEQTNNNALLKIDDNNIFNDAKISYVKSERLQNLEASKTNEKTEPKFHQKECVKDYETCIKEGKRNAKIKNIIDFGESNCNSIKSLVVKK